MKKQHQEKMEGILETMTINEVRSFTPEVVLLPIGSTEPHGPHLPYGTDTFIAGSISNEAVRLANEENARILCLPTLPISNNVNFKGFPFACRIGVETLMNVLMDVVTALREDGIRKIVMVNGHGGNDATVNATLRQIYDRFQQSVFVCSCGPCDFSNGLHSELFKDHSPHAGDMETSLIQYIESSLVVEEKRQPSPMMKSNIPALQSGQVAWVRSWHHFLPISCGGRPDMATKEKGKDFFETCAKGLAEFLINLSMEAWHEKFPFSKE